MGAMPCQEILMRSRSAATVLLGVILAGCAHEKAASLADEIRVRKYADDLVSVASALELARASYVLGCVTARRDAGMAPARAACMKDAEAHVRDDVLFILDEDGAGTPRKP